MNILWLPAWYPNQLEPYSGDFIQRHAKAVSLYHAVQVIHVVRDKEGGITKHVQEENHSQHNLEEKIIYYYSPRYFLTIIDKIIANRRYKILYRKAIENYIAVKGKPACSHVHVADKNALQALWLKKRYGIPFVISEHWTVYLPQAKPYFKEFHPMFRILWRKVIKRSTAISVVSNYLGNAISQIQKNIAFTVIPNVVDSTVFFPAEKKEETIPRFVHISGLDYQKNAEAILQAFAIVKQSGHEFSLSVFGPVRTGLQLLAAELGVEKQVYFYGESPQQRLALAIQQSRALILYSRYETFGCVLIEANACGIPAVISELPVFHEIITEGINGYFVPAENPAALAATITRLIREPQSDSNRNGIAATALSKYNYKTVGELFSKFYEKALGH